MGIYIMNFIILLVLLIISQEVNSTKDGYVEMGKMTMSSKVESNTLAILRLDRNGIGDVNRSKKTTDVNLSRVKRQYNNDPYYSRRNRYPYPYPLPVVIGGGFGLGGFGGRGFGGRGFGGRGFGGRGFGGRGFGGRGIGGFGGRGIGGGGRGGGRG